MFDFEDEALKSLDKQISDSNEKLDCFIEKRVHPKTQEKLQEKIIDHISLLYSYIDRENELYYKNGVADGIKLMMFVMQFI